MQVVVVVNLNFP